MAWDAAALAPRLSQALSIVTKESRLCLPVLKVVEDEVIALGSELAGLRSVEPVAFREDPATEWACDTCHSSAPPCYSPRLPYARTADIGVPWRARLATAT